MNYNTFSIIFVVIICVFKNTYAVDCDVAPDPKDGVGCCKTPHLANKEFHEECVNEVGGLSTSGFNLTRQCVLIECVFHKYGVINDDGEVDVEDIKEGVKSKLDSYPGWESIFNDAADKCVVEGMELRDELKEKHDELKNCNPMYAYIVACIHVHMMIECPEADRGGDDAKCDNLREYFMECPAPFPSKFNN